MLPISNHTMSTALKVTALINILAGIGALAAPQLHAELMLSEGAVLDGLVLRYHIMVWGFVTAMGFGYAIASRSPENQTGLILAAGLGKLCAVAVWAEMLLNGYGSLLMVAGIGVDGCLGVLFLLYFFSNRHKLKFHS